VTALYWTLGLVALQRLVELARARRNTARLRRRGAVEADARGYPLFVLLHSGWLASLALFVPAATLPDWPLIGVFAMLQLGRIWVILSLGGYWTTRILTLPDAPLVRTGPFRYFRHPNYLLVVAEIAVLPLAFGAVAIAAIFSALNLMLIARRIRIEERVLAPRRGVSTTMLRT
jgi:methyltransferase